MDVVSGFKEIEERLEGREWTDEEDEILFRYYLIEKENILKRFKNRTFRAVKHRAIRLGVTSSRLWTKEMDDIFRVWYPIEGAEVYKRIPGKTKNSCHNRAKELGIKRFSWNAKKVEMLEDLLETQTNLKKIGKILGVSSKTIKHKMKELNLNKHKKHNSNNHKFVYFDKARNMYYVSMNIDGKNKCFGRFYSEDEAIRVAMEKAKEYGKAV